MNSLDMDKFYEILALIQYNSERWGLLQSLLKTFIIKETDNFDIKKELSAIEVNKEKSILETIFRDFDNIITAGLNLQTIVEYIFLRYEPFSDIFSKTHRISLKKFLFIAFELGMFINENSIKVSLSSYQFTSKEEYANLKFIAFPDKNYINNWKQIITIDLDEFLLKTDSITKEDIEIFLEIYTFDQHKLLEEPNLRFKEYPLFHYEDKIIFVNPSIYLKYLPHKINIMLNKCKSYSAKKGKIFENIALDLIERIPSTKLDDRNIPYDIYELDGLMNSRRSTWFIECKSRDISPESLLGDSKKIAKDIERAIEDSLKQGTRAIKYKDTKYFSRYKIKNRVGILIIIEGIFPNIRLPNIPGISNPLDACEYPVCVFNYFDLKLILEQPDANMFEEFLIWRSQKNMPIYAFDECDYWGFFNDRYRQNKEVKKMFKLNQDYNQTIIYSSPRFNNKNYLNKIIENNNKLQE
ncbi:MAG: hypothetical protein OIN89_08780 [Candidatus Methanoperedens sp.]|jgi:hypothetical protein|nr:hypothetical protein [Candidatus Methanoperedens sp.]PKL53303.1 MAG: hypothetical protein CVV36_07780 [Candidatus Methanoperedenaceae archaeon HGW-Methanoperedenaceae-1]